MKRFFYASTTLKGSLAAIALLSTMLVGAQKNLTLYGLSGSPQALSLNPAFKPQQRVYISLPLGMQNVSVMNTGFRLSDALEPRSQDDSLEINPQLAVDVMGKTNFVNVESYNELLGFGLRAGKNYFTFNIANRTQARITYPKTLVQFAVEGNGGEMMGERVALDGIAIDALSYVEYGFGVNRQLTEKLSVGGRFKLLSGVGNVKTKRSQLGISTDATTYEITVDGAVEVNTSNVSPFYKDTADGERYNPTPSFYNFKNSGVAVDLGLSYQLNDNIRLDASMLDFGFIHWKTNVSNYKSNEFNFNFKGINFDASDFDTTQSVDRFVDSLRAAFGHEETNEAYTTSLYTRFLIGGQLKVTEFFNLGALLYNEFAASRYTPGLSLSAGVQAGKWLHAALSYSLYGRSFGNIGLGFTMRGGPVQFYVSTDNIFGLLDPASAKYVQAAFGINVVIGHGDDEQKEKKKKKKDKE